MTLNEMLKKKMYEEIWDSYIGFLNLSLKDYMIIQERLLQEQIDLYYKCELGKRFFKNSKPTNIKEFRENVPLTDYFDYADVLLKKDNSKLPSPAAIWIETTWIGGMHPIKVAPYTTSMIESHRSNCLACAILATSTKKKVFSLRKNFNILYGLAPLPYLTGIFPYLLEHELDMNFLPSTKVASKMRFSERNKVGLKLGMQKGLDALFGLTSVIAKISDDMSSNSSSKSYNPFKTSIKMNFRIVSKAISCKINNTKILPKDIFKLKAICCAGTDSAIYKDKIERVWGVRPLEIFGGTEATWIGTETWSKDGLVLFPDSCFYEFIPENEMEKNLENPDYIPRTYLINELSVGTNYEIVITNFKGGAFLRYRIGDIFKCISIINEKDGISFPQFRFVDRIPSVIDICGFTRITEETINETIAYSGLEVGKWVVVKEFDEDKVPFIHLYLEKDKSQTKTVYDENIIRDHLAIYFRYIDSDYNDLKKLLGIEPLKITLMSEGTIDILEQKLNRKLRVVNPKHADLIELRILLKESGVIS